MPAPERYRLTVAYDGKTFFGFQRQKNLATVQLALEKALSRVLGEDVTVVPSGRTDAGVHALGQVVHFDLHSPKARVRAGLPDVTAKLNGVLPPAIAVFALRPAPHLHARKNALRKTYAYLILLSRRRNPFLEDKVWRLNLAPDLRAMRRAARHLIGRHDFGAFCAADSSARDKTRRIEAIRITEAKPAPFFSLPGETCVMIEVTAGGFLKQMVRAIVGTLVSAGLAKIAPARVGEILRSRDRRLAGPTAPARGLYLAGVEYPPEGTAAR